MAQLQRMHTWPHTHTADIQKILTILNARPINYTPHTSKPHNLPYAMHTQNIRNADRVFLIILKQKRALTRPHFARAWYSTVRC